MSVSEIINGLAQSVGPAGAEGGAAALASELLGDFVPVRRDTLGNVIAEFGKKDAREHILLDAHIDEIGMIVTFIDDDGFLHVSGCGGADRRTLIDAEVLVYGESRLCGVVCCMPPHLTDPANRSKAPAWDGIYIDIGYSAQRARELVPLGSRVIVRSRPTRLLGGKLCSKALDNRAGAAALIRVVELLHDEQDKLPCRVSVVLSVREEVGGQGAATAAFSLAPTQAVAVDVSFARQPGAPAASCGTMGDGPMIGYSPYLDLSVTKHLRSLCVEKNIPWQNEIMGGSTGTNADKIAASRGGVRTGLVSIAQKNMHTAVEIIDPEDVENTAQLLAAFVRTGGASIDNNA